MFTLSSKKGENMNNRRLRKWVLPTISTIMFVGIVVGVFQITQMIGANLSEENGNYVINSLIDNARPVVESNATVMLKPYSAEGVAVSKSFYNKEDSEEQQQKSLIYYENIYMQNTGVLYSSDNQFDIINVLDGTVKNIKEDELLGYVIEIENTDKITTIYQSVDNITVAIGDVVEQGKIIATSGNNALSNEKDNCLHFSIYVNGKLTNPESLYDVDINSIKQ